MNLKIIISLLFLALLLSCGSDRGGETPKAKIHFSQTGSNLGNPVALIFSEGNYHLFFEKQSNGNIADWGHAQSSDLVHWENLHLNIPVAPEFKKHGTIVIDWGNSSGLGQKIPPLVAIFTPEGNLQQTPVGLQLALKYSTDNGTSWSQYTAQPVVLPDFHSPVNSIKVIWHEETQKWIMLVLSGYNIHLYSSTNLINWEYVSRFGESVFVKLGQWSSVDFFPMEVVGSSQTKWVLFISGDTGSPNDGSGIQYFTGDFDGYVFKATRDKPKWLDNGSDNFSGVVLSDHLVANKPVYFIGNIYSSLYERLNITPEKSGAFTLARKLILKDGYDGLSIFSEPVESLETIEKGEQLIREISFSNEVKFRNKLKLPLEINLKFDLNNRLYLDMAEVFGVNLSNGKGDKLVMGYHSQKGYFFIADPTISQKYQNSWSGFVYAPYVIGAPVMDIKIIVDYTSVELFAMYGLASLTRKYSFADNWVKMTLFTEGGKITLREGNTRELKSIW